MAAATSLPGDVTPPPPSLQNRLQCVSNSETIAGEGPGVPRAGKPLRLCRKGYDTQY